MNAKINRPCLLKIDRCMALLNAAIMMMFLFFKLVEMMERVVVKQALFVLWRLFVGSRIRVKWCLIIGCYYFGAPSFNICTDSWLWSV